MRSGGGLSLGSFVASKVDFKNAWALIEQDRLLLDLKYAEGLPSKEIADKLGKKPGTQPHARVRAVSVSTRGLCIGLHEAMGLSRPGRSTRPGSCVGVGRIAVSRNWPGLWLHALSAATRSSLADLRPPRYTSPSDELPPSADCRSCRVGSEPTRIIIIKQPLLTERYALALVGHGIAHAEVGSNVYLAGESRLSDDQEELLALLGWQAPITDVDVPGEMPANWTLPLVHGDWQHLTEMFASTMIGILGVCEHLRVEVMAFGADPPCRDCSWTDQPDGDD